MEDWFPALCPIPRTAGHRVGAQWIFAESTKDTGPKLGRQGARLGAMGSCVGGPCDKYTQPSTNQVPGSTEEAEITSNSGSGRGLRDRRGWVEPQRCSCTERECLCRGKGKDKVRVESRVGQRPICGDSSCGFTDDGQVGRG